MARAGTISKVFVVKTRMPHKIVKGGIPRKINDGMLYNKRLNAA